MSEAIENSRCRVEPFPDTFPSIVTLYGGSTNTMWARRLTNNVLKDPSARALPHRMRCFPSSQRSPDRDIERVSEGYEVLQFDRQDLFIPLTVFGELVLSAIAKAGSGRRSSSPAEPSTPERCPASWPPTNCRGRL
jgi:hypothetical protein